MLDNIYLNSFLVDILKKDGEFEEKKKQKESYRSSPTKSRQFC